MREKVALMCRAQRHGGPDDEGLFVAERANLVFGHRRLAIIDLSSGGHQPMSDRTQIAWITFNGEIYNYLELKKQLLLAGVAFNSESDTEVILQVYLHWGVAGFAKLRGMFAFALYDIKSNLTYLVRDTLGIKPLYYHTTGGQLSFASETRAFKEAGIANETDPAWIIKFLAFGHVPEPDTTLTNVRSLAKGNFLRWDHSNDTYTITSYEQKSAISYITNTRFAQEAIRTSLSAAVSGQLIADAPIGVFLSGGTDSSLLALLANQQLQHQLKTVSLFFTEKTYDESLYQQEIQRKINGEKFTHLITRQDLDQCLPEILAAMDMPTTDGINSWFISKYARLDGLKTVLSGIGADELFGGYPSFKRIKYIRYLRSFPKSVLTIVNALLSNRYKKTNFLVHQHPLADYLFLRGLFSAEEIAGILNCDEQEVYRVLFSPDQIFDPGCLELERASWYETNIYMQNQLLRDTDVMSMRNGLEVRIPFLHEDFVHTVNAIAPEIRFNQRQPKKILIDTFQDILPPAIWKRPKMGFSFPLQQWLKNNEMIGNEANYHGKTAKDIVHRFNHDKIHWSKVFALYQVQQNG